VYCAEERRSPSLFVPAIAATTIANRNMHADHMAGVVGGIEAAAAEAAGLVSAARAAGVCCLARLENVSTSLATSGFCVFGTFHSALRVTQLQGLWQLSLWKQESKVFVAASGQRPKETRQELARCRLRVSVVALGRQVGQELAELLLLSGHWRIHGLVRSVK